MHGNATAVYIDFCHILHADTYLLGIRARACTAETTKDLHALVVLARYESRMLMKAEFMG
jgi:hypothetical protein